MQDQYYNHLKEMLLKLKNNKGHFIIQDGYFAAKRMKEKEANFFCQLFKNGKKDPIIFEAVSHHFNESLSKDLILQFSDLGFVLEEKYNYTKEIFLNSNKDIDSTALEIVHIFENIYDVDEQSIYDFDDQIEITIEKPKRKKTSNEIVVSKPIAKPSVPKLSGCAWVFIISTVIAIYGTFFGDSSEESSAQDEIVYNSEWDASFQQVVGYLKKDYLNDPDSYQSVSWSSVVKLNDTKEIGVASYQVRHKYRAKKAFGGYVTEEKIFKLDYQGNIVDVKDWQQ